MQKHLLRQPYVDELRNIYSAEIQSVKLLPKMAKASSNAELRMGLEEHLRQTAEHVTRLEQIFDMLGEKPTRKKCLGMEALVKEGIETLKKDYGDALMDTTIVGAARRVEHYEMAAYTTVRAFAEWLGENEHASLIGQTLKEEQQMNEDLTRMAEQIRARAGNTEKETDGQQPSKQTKGTSKRAA